MLGCVGVGWARREESGELEDIQLHRGHTASVINTHTEIDTQTQTQTHTHTHTHTHVHTRTDTLGGLFF